MIGVPTFEIITLQLYKEFEENNTIFFLAKKNNQ